MKRKYFGTDGIRGRLGEHPMLPGFALTLGWAAGRVLSSGQTGGRVLLGRDTRISGELFESALQSGLVAAGMQVELLGVVPTAAVAYLTRTLGAVAGIVITASHNPATDNGIKFFSAKGTKLDDALETAIEKLLDEPMNMADIFSLGNCRQRGDASGRYIEFCKSTYPRGQSLEGLKIVLDCAHGASFKVAPQIFDELAAGLVVLGDRPDGLNINEDCGATATGLLQRKVIEQQADLGIAFDGDGDRVIMVDHTGAEVDGDELLFIIAMARHRQNHLPGVVGTLMSNLGMEHALQAAGIAFERARVGDRYVLERMLQHDWYLGGESSGHVICREYLATGDGIIAALQVLAEMVQTGRSLHELKGGMQKYPQVMHNIRLEQGEKLLADSRLREAVRVAEARFSGKGRVLLRPSGTEPVVRVMAEGEDMALVDVIAAELAGFVRKLANDN